MKYVLTVIIIGLSTALIAQHSDCQTAHWLCDDSSIDVDQFQGWGLDRMEIRYLPCYSKAFNETQSYWFKWRIQEAGWLAFRLEPHRAHDDLDFVLFRASDKGQARNDFQEVRCVVSGINLGSRHTHTSDPCRGATGLTMDAEGVMEEAGCYGMDDHFAQAVYAESGEVYALFVHNTSSSDGFRLLHDGTAIFQPLKQQISLDIVDHEARRICIHNPLNVPLDQVETSQWTLSSGQVFDGPGPHCLELDTDVSTLTVRIETRLTSGCTSIDELQADQLFETDKSDIIAEIFPNPADDIAHLRVDMDPMADYTVHITDHTGRIVHVRSGISGSIYDIPCAHLAAGIYNVEVVIPALDRRIHTRFVRLPSQ